jgi:hypothetical protein
VKGTQCCQGCHPLDVERGQAKSNPKSLLPAPIESTEIPVVEQGCQPKSAYQVVGSRVLLLPSLVCASAEADAAAAAPPPAASRPAPATDPHHC